MTMTEINGKIVEDAPYHDMSEHFCEFPADWDKCDYVIKIGSIVGFAESYENPDNYGKAYFVVNMPNCGDMVELSEITDMSGKYETWKANPDIPVISVAPWKIGLI